MDSKLCCRHSRTRERADSRGSPLFIPSPPFLAICADCACRIKYSASLTQFLQKQPSVLWRMVIMRSTCLCRGTSTVTIPYLQLLLLFFLFHNYAFHASGNNSFIEILNLSWVFLKQICLDFVHKPVCRHPSSDILQSN